MPRPASAGRTARLLSLVPWVLANDSPLVDDVCARFAITRGELEADIVLLSMVGLPPYTPDVLIEPDIEGDRVRIRGAYFEQPLRLSQQEGLALVAAGATLSTAPGYDPAGPLARGVGKVAAVLGIEVDDDVSVSLGEADERVLEDLRRAVDERRVVRLRYYSHARHAFGDRDVEPLRVHSAEGAWYLVAWCRQAEGERVFRLDRLDHHQVLDEVFAARPVEDREPFVRDPSIPRVTLDVPASGHWVAQRYPVDKVEDLPGGGQRVTLAVAARPWLERLLLRLGPEAKVVAGDEADERCGAVAARRILERYRDP